MLMTNREYIISFFTRKLMEMDEETLERAYTNGIGQRGEIETICETCQRLYPGQCAIGTINNCKMSPKEWFSRKAVFKKR